MNVQSKKSMAIVMLALSLSTCAPVLYAADEPKAEVIPVEVTQVTDEQIRKDWPEVMRMVSRMNAQWDKQEAAFKNMPFGLKILGGVAVTVVAGVIIAGASGRF
jgi:hypothetical protein